MTLPDSALVALSLRYWKPAAFLAAGAVGLVGLYQAAVWMTPSEAYLKQWEASARTRPCPDAGDVPYVTRYSLGRAAFITRWCRPPGP
jgi:hypothetical protein